MRSADSSEAAQALALLKARVRCAIGLIERDNAGINFTLAEQRDQMT
jgi:hypothetical protein